MEKNSLTPEQQLFLATVNESMEDLKKYFKEYKLDLKLIITPVAEDDKSFDRSKSRY